MKLPLLGVVAGLLLGIGATVALDITEVEGVAFILFVAILACSLVDLLIARRAPPKAPPDQKPQGPV